MSKIDKIQIGDSTYNLGANAEDIEGLQQIQYSTIPTASADNVGKIIQYVGTNTTNYISGAFYKCIQSGTNYIWENQAVEIDKDILIYDDKSTETYMIIVGQGYATLPTSTAGDNIPTQIRDSLSRAFTLQRKLHGFTKPLRLVIICGNVIVSTGSSAWTLSNNITSKTLRYGHLEGGSSFQSTQNGNLVWDSTNNKYKVELFMWKRNGNYLLPNNTSSYTPTGNYNPAHKKYVDDSIAAAIGNAMDGEY